ncbi:MAG: HAD family phosphatase [Thermoguttaceae bacterium]|jgi:HAD superfamily hydrolase (TIGR01509 family)|nr:HAD family phosphatase [Thermoguttaceae bacterium]
MLTILWDNDGVLVNTEGLYFQACREALGSISIGLTLEQFKEISLRRGESVFLLAAEKGIDAETVARLRRERDWRYTELLTAQSPVNDGVEDVLRALYGRVRMGVVTNARRQHFEAAHANSSVIQYMDFVLTREDYTHSKPHPEPYLTAMERNGLRPEHCIIVEDSERGLAAAAAAGVDCIIVLSEWTRDGDFTKAVAVVEDIAGVPEQVLRRAGL